jgi:hypothetical protein
MINLWFSKQQGLNYKIMKTYMLNFDQGPSRPSGKNLTPKEQEAVDPNPPRDIFKCPSQPFDIVTVARSRYPCLCFSYIKIFVSCIIKVAHVLIGSSVKSIFFFGWWQIFETKMKWLQLLPRSIGFIYIEYIYY